MTEHPTSHYLLLSVASDCLHEPLPQY